MKHAYLKMLVCSLLMLAYCGTLRAQESSIPAPKFDLGIKVGMNLNKLDADNWQGSYKTNLLGGIFAGIHGKRFGVAIEGLFSQSNYITGDSFNSIYKQYLQAGKDSIKNGAFRVNYFNIPLLLQVKVVSRVWLELGPQYSGVISVKDVDAMVKDAKQLFKSGDLSGVVGLKITLPAHFIVSGRYVVGLTDANNTSVSDAWKQRSLQFSLGYNFL